MFVPGSPLISSSKCRTFYGVHYHSLQPTALKLHQCCCLLPILPCHLCHQPRLWTILLALQLCLLISHLHRHQLQNSLALNCCHCHRQFAKLRCHCQFAQPSRCPLEASQIQYRCPCQLAKSCHHQLLKVAQVQSLRHYHPCHCHLCLQALLPSQPQNICPCLHTLGLFSHPQPCGCCYR